MSTRHPLKNSARRVQRATGVTYQQALRFLLTFEKTPWSFLRDYSRLIETFQPRDKAPCPGCGKPFYPIPKMARYAPTALPRRPL